jgi:hypothetical protein
MDGLRVRPDATVLARVGQVGFSDLSPAEVTAMSNVQRQTLASVARCALAPDVTLVYPDGLVLAGGLGLAPEIEKGACETACQEILSACLLAHVNSSAATIPIWLTSDAPSMGRVTSPSYPIEEATFFGNLWAAGAPAAYCKAGTVSESRVVGRLGILPGEGELYEDLRADTYYRDAEQRQAGTCGACARSASGAIEACSYEGATFAHPVTVWRARTYEAESAALSGGARVSGDAARVLRVRASWMKPGASVVFSDVMAQVGANTLAVYYTNGDPLGLPARQVAISVNGGPARVETLATRGAGWRDPQLLPLTFDELHEGANTITFTVPDGAEGPDLDWIQVVPALQ